MRILFVAARYPWPPRRGDQMRAVQFVEALGSRHDVVLLTPQPGDKDRDDSHSGRRDLNHPGRGDLAEGPSSGSKARVVFYRRSWLDLVLGLMRAAVHGDPWQSAVFYSRDLARQLREWGAQSDLAILQLVRLSQHLRDLEGTPVLVDLIDCLSLSFERRAKRDQAWRRLFWRWESRRLRVAELELLGRAHGACLVCQRDCAHLSGMLPESRAQKLRLIRLARAPATDGGGSPAASGPRQETVVMTGNLGYFPNLEGAIWLLEEVWPRLRDQRPCLRLVLAGARPPVALERLASRQEVELRASPQRLEEVLRAADVAVAPIWSGAGVPVKVLEAWAHGVPAVASPWAAEGAGASHGIELLCARTPSEWVCAILRLLDDPELRRDLSRAGLERLKRCHSEEIVRRELLEWVDGLVLTAAPP